MLKFPNWKKVFENTAYCRKSDTDMKYRISYFAALNTRPDHCVPYFFGMLPSDIPMAPRKCSGQDYNSIQT